MNEPSYLIGRFLSLSDSLHLSYCHVVRGGQIPPTLAGNAVLGTALSDPISAMASLASRLRVYIGWATTAPVPKDVDKAKWTLIAKKTLSEFADVESRLAGRLEKWACTDLEKAQMLLGYLAREKTDSAII